jgi:hypothetical protein
MEQVVDEQFLHQARAFALRHRCQDCLHFLPDISACAHGWPSQIHRLIPGRDGRLVFCKEFELA